MPRTGEPRQSARAWGRVQAGIESAQTGDRRFAAAVEVAVLGKRTHLPALVPVPSRGRHRSPRRGACFMELASYLAGEWWSDDPACTHPLLAAPAPRCQRLHLRRRPALAGLVPSVIGLAGEDLHIDAWIALVCARTALPVAAATTQQVMALSVPACERVLAAWTGGRPAGWTSRAGPCWRRFRWPPSGPAASPAAPRPRRRCPPALRGRHGACRGGGDRARVHPASRPDAVRPARRRDRRVRHLGRPGRGPGH
jgi:hypothetical protein